MSLLIRFKYSLLASLGTILVLWGMLLPGYILTLDLVWGPHVSIPWDINGFNNALLIHVLFFGLGTFLPSWVVEKFMLFALFFFLFYIPLKLLPWVERRWARVFAAALFALNPFVYARMLAGQWLVLAGYALFPLVFFALLKLCEKFSLRSALLFGLSLTIMGMFSIHFLYLSLVVSFLWIAAHVIKNFWEGSGKANVQLVRGAVYAGLLFLVLSSYWIVPAYFRPAPVEARFDAAHFAAFAAAPNDLLPTMPNVLALGGYWGEGTSWDYYFLWPQSQPLFWAAFACVAALVLLGIFVALKRPKLRFPASLLLILGVLAYVTALGASDDTPFKSLNLFLYAHVPLWSGLRDSQKIAGVLAFVYVVFAALGVEQISKHLPRRWYLQKILPVFLLVLPAVFGMYEWGGFNDQLQPTDYPASWYAAKNIIDSVPSADKVLVLPWHGYLSLPFNHQLVESNPAPTFFGADRVVAGRSIDVGAVHDEEVDPAYRALDAVLSAKEAPSPEILTAALQADNIDYILILKDQVKPPEANWTDYLDAGDAFDGVKTEILINNTVSLQKLVQS